MPNIGKTGVTTYIFLMPIRFHTLSCTYLPIFRFLTTTLWPADFFLQIGRGRGAFPPAPPGRKMFVFMWDQFLFDEEPNASK